MKSAFKNSVLPFFLVALAVVPAFAQWKLEKDHDTYTISFTGKGPKSETRIFVKPGSGIVIEISNFSITKNLKFVGPVIHKYFTEEATTYLAEEDIAYAGISPSTYFVDMKAIVLSLGIPTKLLDMLDPEIHPEIHLKIDLGIEQFAETDENPNEGFYSFELDSFSRRCRQYRRF
jgi:hypothetical protein